MKLSFFKIIFLLFVIPIYLFCATEQEASTNTNTSEVQTSVEDKDIVEEKLAKQEKIAQEVVENINNETYLKKETDQKKYNREISYLTNRIKINKKENNDIAVKRDEIKLIELKELRMYENTLIDIIYAKRSFKEKSFFVNILSNNIKVLQNDLSLEYKDIYTQELKNDNKIAKDLVENYEKLVEQNETQLYTLQYLLDNINLYRKTNFFIDEFNLQYFIKKIDALPFLSPVSELVIYHFNFSIGELLLVIMIIIFFRLLNTRIITLLTSILSRIFENTKKQKDKDIDEEDIEDSEDESNIHVYLKESTEKPLVMALYILSFHISIYILIKDPLLISKIIPWLNTLYMGLVTWVIYSLLSNFISNFAQDLIEKYPNVRREMIVFILRIIKIILIILVILFLFTQLGLDIKAIAASLGVGGIAIALASKDTLANFFGSLNIMTDNSLSQGDWIVTNDVEGTVVDIRMRTTRIRTFDNAMITIPNSQLANAHIKNYSKRRIGRRIKMTLNITYESKMSDIVNLKSDILNMLENHPDIATGKNALSSITKKFEAIKREDLQGVKRTLLVFVDEYASSSINILVYCFTRSPAWENWLGVKEDVIVKINDLVKKNNCDFAYPSQTLFIKKEKEEEIKEMTLEENKEE
ncbi:MAG: mechanosensitive ion channel family protein [Halarcobacter sp.]